MWGFYSCSQFALRLIQHGPDLNTGLLLFWHIYWAGGLRILIALHEGPIWAQPKWEVRSTFILVFIDPTYLWENVFQTADLWSSKQGPNPEKQWRMCLIVTCKWSHWTWAHWNRWKSSSWAPQALNQLLPCSQVLYWVRAQVNQHMVFP